VGTGVIAMYFRGRTQITGFLLTKVPRKILRAWKDKMKNLGYFIMKNEVVLCCPEHGGKTRTYRTVMGKDHIT
jgi:hypothetical protein